MLLEFSFTVHTTITVVSPLLSSSPSLMNMVTAAEAITAFSFCMYKPDRILFPCHSNFRSTFIYLSYISEGAPSF